MITKKDGTPLCTDKDVYEYVFASLREQGEKSVDIDETCVYRGHTLSLQNKVREKIYNEYYDDEIAFENFVEEMRYHEPNAKCAAGHLIADEHYDSNFENRLVDGDIFDAIKKSNPYWKTGPYSLKMVQVLQSIHDTNLFSKMMELYADLSNKFTPDNNYYSDSTKELDEPDF